MPQRLVRRLETRTRTALTPEARLANVAGALETRNPERTSAAVGTRMLADDVFTTGATLLAAAAAFAAVGERGIGAVTFGRAGVPDFI